MILRLSWGLQVMIPLMDKAARNKWASFAKKKSRKIFHCNHENVADVPRVPPS
jgi:hypothetical protein